MGRNSFRVKASASSIAIAAIFTLSACGQSEEPVYSDHQHQQTLELQNRSVGNIPIDFSVPPTLENQATAQLEGVNKILDFGSTGVVATNAEKNQLFRINDGKLVWTSEKINGEFSTVKFVQSGTREWIVGMSENNGKTRISTYDAYSHSQDDKSLRGKETDGDALVFRDGIVFTEDKKLYNYSPSHGTQSQVKLPSDSTLLAPTTSGYLISNKGRIAAAATDNNAAWDSLKNRPEGFSDKAKNKVVGYSPSSLALEWEQKGKDKVTTFHNTNTGELIATYEGTIKKGNMNQRIGNAESLSMIFLKNVAVDTNKKTIKEYDKDIVSINKGLIYFNDGSGEDVATGNKAWEDDQNGESPSLIWKDSAFYVHDDALNVINLKTVERKTSEES